jgi:hypothetical protein
VTGGENEGNEKPEVSLVKKAEPRLKAGEDLLRV